MELAPFSDQNPQDCSGFGNEKLAERVGFVPAGPTLYQQLTAIPKRYNRQNRSKAPELERFRNGGLGEVGGVAQRSRGQRGRMSWILRASSTPRKEPPNTPAEINQSPSSRTNLKVKPVDRVTGGWRANRRRSFRRIEQGGRTAARQSYLVCLRARRKNQVSKDSHCGD